MQNTQTKKGKTGTSAKWQLHLCCILTHILMPSFTQTCHVLTTMCMFTPPPPRSPIQKSSKSTVFVNYCLVQVCFLQSVHWKLITRNKQEAASSSHTWYYNSGAQKLLRVLVFWPEKGGSYGNWNAYLVNKKQCKMMPIEKLPNSNPTCCTKGTKTFPESCCNSALAERLDLLTITFKIPS